MPVTPLLPQFLKRFLPPFQCLIRLVQLKPDSRRNIRILRDILANGDYLGIETLPRMPGIGQIRKRLEAQPNIMSRTIMNGYQGCLSGPKEIACRNRSLP